MAHDDIPEDDYECYPCPRPHCSGDITRKSGHWECNTCDFEVKPKPTDAKPSGPGGKEKP